jgi:hypothetical protein
MLENAVASELLSIALLAASVLALSRDAARGGRFSRPRELIERCRHRCWCWPFVGVSVQKGQLLCKRRMCLIIYVGIEKNTTV